MIKFEVRDKNNNLISTWPTRQQAIHAANMSGGYFQVTYYGPRKDLQQIAKQTSQR